jgi:predicted protein tyrosine phosphatase
MNNILILSHKEATLFKPEDDYTVMIRVIDTSNNFKPLFYNSLFKDVLKLKFDDLTAEDFILDPTLVENYRLIDDIQVNKILNFFKKHINCKTIVIHCEMGRSRSPAVALAWCDFTKNKEFSNYIIRNYNYNKTVYNKLKKRM